MCKNTKTTSKKKNEYEDVQYDKTTQYERIVSIIETLRYCSDKTNPMLIRDITTRCARLTNNWYCYKTLERTMELLLELSKDSFFVSKNGGRVARVLAGKNSYAYYWEKDPYAQKLEKALKKAINSAKTDDRKRNIYKELLDKLGFNADIDNEKGWRNGRTIQERKDMALGVKVVTPYEIDF